MKQLLAAAVAFLCAGFAAPSRVDYRLTPEFVDDSLVAMGVEFSFNGEADGETVLELPDAWGGEEELWRGVENLRVVSGAEMSDGARPDLRVLRHRPNARIRMRYRLIQDWAGAPMAGEGNTYRPVIQPGYFHLIGEATFVIPDLPETTPSHASIRRLPRRWSYASDLQHGGLTIGSLKASVSVGGDFRIIERREAQVRLAIRGDWSFSDEEFADEIATIISAQRGFWGDAPSPYLVTVLQLDLPAPGWMSVGGTGLADAFAFFATPNGAEHTITRTLAHEGMHTWIPGRVGGLPEDESVEPLDYWFSEGFTDFFTGRLLVRQGVWGPTEFAADLNQMLDAYGRSSLSTAANASVGETFWTDFEMRRVPYRRGRLIATIWDARLRSQGKSLDAVLREMRRRSDIGDTLDAADMFPLAAASAELDVRGDMARFIEAGERIALPEDVFAPCGRMLTRTLPHFHRGFDIDATQANNMIIAGVDPALPAYAAGLRDGMVMIRRVSGEIDNSELELVYLVRDGEAERTIRYMPRGRGTFTRQQLVLDPDLTGEKLAACRAVLAGPEVRSR